MEQKILHVQMFGKFSLTYGDKQIDGGTNRSKLLWNILSYLLCHRGEYTQAEELTAALWRPEKNDNPSGAMRTAIHRARNLLHELMPDCTSQFLISKSGGYMWDPAVEVVVDTDEFKRLIGTHKSPAEELTDCMAALKLYEGKFLAAQSGELWVMPIQAYYHNLYDQTAEKVIVALEKEGRYEEAAEICRNALQIDPYAEKHNQYLMRLLLQMDRREEVIRVYEDMSKLLMSAFGIMPDQESRALYREALLSVKKNSTVSPEMILEQLGEHREIKGAIVCDYDFFKMMYQAQARTIVRSGVVVHTVLVTLQSRKGAEVSAKSMATAMDHMEAHLRDSLRKGDIITRCSASQFIVMLLAANYENSCRVCNRFVTAFERKYPYTPVRVDYYVQALVPSTQN